VGIFFVMALVLFCLKHRSGTIAAAMMLIINLLPVAYLSIPSSTLIGEQTKQEDLNILQFNLQGGKNKNYKRTLDLISKVDPDIVGLSELTLGWACELENHLTKYPYRIVEPGRGGVSLFSKFPVLKSEVKYFGPLKRPRVVAQLDVDGQKLDVVFIHPVTPMRSRTWRNGELAAVAKDVKAFENPGIVFGDMNTTPWSICFDKLLQDGGLLDSERGFGYQPTWNCKMRISLLPIDHLLFTPQFSVRERRVLGRVGSDHLPVFVKLAYNKS
jgi:endonuclease/exonuclease/phosphatase (EEP) superfamily protein YafD